MIQHKALTCALGGALILAGCGDAPLPSVMQFVEPDLKVTRQIAPPNAKPGTCWGQDATPAVIETVTEQILLQPAEVSSDGTQTQPAAYKTETHQRIVKERQEVWFETPCDDLRNPEFVATRQRALTARRLFRGAITGQMDRKTRRAIRKFQAPQGLDSSILSLAAARQLGIVEIELEDSSGRRKVEENI